MKTRILSFLFVLIGGLFMATSAFAQPTVVKSQKDVTAKDGSTVTYSVTGTGTSFYWTLSGGSNTNTVSSSSTNSVSVTWDNADPGQTYNLDVYLVDANGCYSELYRFAIKIESIVLSITDADTETCSWLETSNKSGNPTALSANDVIEFTLTLDQANGAASPIAVNYTVSNGSLTESRSENITFTGTSGTIHVQVDDFFSNTSTSNKTYTITIDSAKDNNNNDLSISTTAKTATITVHPVPTITLD